MNGKNILIPLDLVHGSAAPLVLAQQLALDDLVSVTLLHVVDLNIALDPPDVYAQLCAESQAALRKLARLFFGANRETRVVVRVGKPADQIVAEAKEASADLIVLCGPKPTKTPRLFRLGTVEEVLKCATCPSMVLPHAWKEAPKASKPVLSEESCVLGGLERRVAVA
jgi:nucleotide-binding universal stress UspA family protein